MAVYPSTSYGRRRRRTRRWIYAASIVMLIVVVTACIYGYRSLVRNRGRIGTDSNAGKGPQPPAIGPRPGPNLPEVSEAPVAEPNPEAAKMIAQAIECIRAKPARIIDAREILNDALAIPMNRQQRRVVKEKLSELADEWLFSRRFFPEDKLCESYLVKPGERLSAIGKRYKVPWYILRDINNIGRAENLRAGERIKVINGPFHARVYRSTFTMDLYLQNTFVKSFRVGLGKPGMETPTGVWVVKVGGKLEKPPWTDPITGKTYHPEDADYPLGSRWIGLEGVEGNAKGRTGFAIHGTKDPNQIGRASSQGCIRLHNGNAILMYNLLMPGFSRVEVVD